MIEISKSIIEKNGKYLLLKRSNQGSYPNAWDFVGGRLDPGETPVQAVVRETKEETSYDIDPGSEISVEEYSDVQDDYKDKNLVFYYFQPEITSGNLKLGADHTDYTWVTIEEMKTLNLHPAVKVFLDKLLIN